MRKVHVNVNTVPLRVSFVSAMKLLRQATAMGPSKQEHRLEVRDIRSLRIDCSHGRPFGLLLLFLFFYIGEEVHEGNWICQLNIIIG